MTESQKSLQYANGNILEAETLGFRRVMLFAVDDSGEFGAGRLFRSLTDRFPEVVDKYESLTDLELGDVHVVHESAETVVVFLIVLSSEDRSTIKESVLEKAIKKSASVVQNIPKAVVNLPRIGYGTDLPFGRVEDLLRKYYLSNDIPCTVFHYTKPADGGRRRAFRALGNRLDGTDSELPSKRTRKPLRMPDQFKDEDESSSSSSDESSEGDYKPSDEEVNSDGGSSSSEEDLADRDDETDDDYEDKGRRFAHRPGFKKKNH